jgi:hypothetical protein
MHFQFPETHDIRNDSETLVTISHRGLWLALILLLLLACWAVAVNLFPGSAAAAMAGNAARLLPVAIVIAVGALQLSLKGLSANPRSKAMKAVLDDELRQQSMQRACRNGLLAVLFAQPALAFGFTFADLPQPLVLMASLTVLTGVATVLGSVLVYDR